MQNCYCVCILCTKVINLYPIFRYPKNVWGNIGYYDVIIEQRMTKICITMIYTPNFATENKIGENSSTKPYESKTARQFYSIYDISSRDN